MKVLVIEEIQALLLDLMKELHKFMDKNNLEYYFLGGSALGALRHNGFIPWDDDIDIGMKRNDYEKFVSVCHNFEGYSVENYKNKNNCDFCLTRIYIPHTKIQDVAIENTKLNKSIYLDIFPLDNVPEDVQLREKYEKKIFKKKKLLQRIDARNYNNTKLQMCVKKTISFVLGLFRQNILSRTDKLLQKYRNIETSLICSLHSQYSFAKQVMPKDVYGTPTLHKFADTEFYVPEKLHQYLSTLYGQNYMELPPEHKRRKIPVVFYDENL